MSKTNEELAEIYVSGMEELEAIHHGIKRGSLKYDDTFRQKLLDAYTAGRESTRAIPLPKEPEETENA